MKTSSNNVLTDVESVCEAETFDADALDDLTAEELAEIYDIDWDELPPPNLEEDLKVGYLFNPADYPTDEAMLAAMEKVLHDIVQEGLDENAAVRSLDAAR